MTAPDDKHEGLLAGALRWMFRPLRTRPPPRQQAEAVDTQATARNLAKT